MVLCAVLGAWAAAIVGWPLVFVVTLGLAWTLLTLAAIDILAFRLPDLLTLPLAAAGLAVSLTVPDVLWTHGIATAIAIDKLRDHALGLVIGYCAFAALGWAFARVRGREGLGLGDAKLAAAAGAWLGWAPLPSVILIACAAGFLWVATMTVMRGRAALTERIPFGVALAIAIWVVWLYGPLEFPGAAS